MELNPKQSKFIEEYLIDLNGTQAAIRAGYSSKTAFVQASRLLSNANICNVVAEKRKILQEKTQITQEWVLNRLKAISDKCFEGIPYYTSKGVKTQYMLIDSAGCNRATEMIGKHLGFFEADNKVNNTITVTYANKPVGGAITNSTED